MAVIVGSLIIGLMASYSAGDPLPSNNVISELVLRTWRASGRPCAVMTSGLDTKAIQKIHLKMDLVSAVTLSFGERKEWNNDLDFGRCQNVLVAADIRDQGEIDLIEDVFKDVTARTTFLFISFNFGNNKLATRQRQAMLATQLSSPDLLLIYHLCPNNALPPREINVFGAEKGFHLQFPSGISNPSKHTSGCPSILHGRNLSVSALGREPYLYYTPDKKGIAGGSDVETIKVLSKRFGFDFHYKMEKAWVQRVNGEIIGAARSVSDGVSEFAIAHMPMEHVAYTVGEFSHYWYQTGAHLISAKPRPIPMLFNLVKPFSAEVWAYLFAVVVAVVFLAAVLTRFGYLKGNKMCGEEAMAVGLHMYGIVLTQTQLQAIQGSRPTLLSLRILKGFWILLTIFLMHSYECNLRAYIMAVDYEKPIETDQDLLDRKQPLYFIKGTPFINMYAKSTSEVKRALAKPALEGDESLFIQLTKDKKPPIWFQNMLIEEGGAYSSGSIMEMAIFPWYEEIHGYNPFMVSKYPALPFHSGLLMRKHQSYHEAVNQVIDHLVDGGIINHNIKRGLATKYQNPERKGSKSPNLEPFRLEHLALAFMIFSIGITVSVVAFLLEKCSV